MFAPRVSAKSKTVTSGRLTGAAKANRTRGTPKSKPGATYSLYSEDAEEQVVTLHKGLDRCAALLGDILQCENPGAVPKLNSAVKDGGTKSRPHTPTGKKAIRRSISKSGVIPRNTQMVRKKSSKPQATTPQRSVPLPHSGVSLHSPVRKPLLQKTPSKPENPRVQLGSLSLLPADCVPERDQGSAEVSETEGNMRRVKDLLGELRTLMAGHGDSAQTYLYLLEQTVLSALCSEASKNPTEQQRTEELKSLQSHNAQLQRQVMVLQQQIQELEATQQLLNSQVSSLQVQLSAADKELTQVQNSLQETETRLQSGQEENISIKMELESTRGRLRVTLQDRLKLEGKLQQKQQEIETLHRIIDSVDNQPVGPPGGAKEHITQYLLSLEQSQPIQTQPSHQVPGTLQGPERDVESVVSDWSVQSESSFNTRDEAVFRDGLAALDASIASLQKTLKMDLVKM